MRLAEFEDLFRANLIALEVPEPGRALLSLEGDHELFATVQDLTDRESQCCSFFDFTLTEQRPLPEGAGRVWMELQIGVPAEQQPVLDALVEHARAAQASCGLER